ncbi:hypothetical protein AB0M23_00050 [Streptomyces sp. NPDC052077]|uniref:hypothetical protein n=1 Tax=Streptomyces sp. NPDC052077 TaxID=3154757 RepID=UPI003418BD5D
MSEWDHVTVTDPQGPVNNGPGPQYIHYGGGPDWMIRKGIDSLRIAREDRVRLADRFARPAGYRIAADQLEKPGSVVLLEAEPGSGRRAAAIMLLHEVGEEGRVGERGARFDELPLLEKEGDPFTPSSGDRFLIDLSGMADEDHYSQELRRVTACRSGVQRAGAHMVVVLPWGMRHARSPELEPHTVRLRRPRGITVVTRHLRMERMTFRSSDLMRADLQHLCDQSPMHELARLARLVGSARDSGRFGGDFTDWLGQALHAVTDRAEEVAHQVRTVRTAPERGLLLATAMFEESRADTVHEAWLGLMRAVKHEEETTTELERTDFGEHLRKLEVERDPEGRLRFRQLAYAEAVRTYFWTNFPSMRESLRNWIGHATALRGLTTDDRVNVVVRFGEQSLAAGRPDHLFSLVVRWADNAPRGFRDPRALAGCELGLGHERFGGWFRDRIYKCATGGPLSDGLIRVLTAACLQGLSATHPDLAIVRLHHLAVRKENAALEAKKALLALVHRKRRLHRLLVNRLRVWSGREPEEAEPHLRLLTEVLGSDRTPDPPPWPDLFRGWETVFAQMPTDLWNPLVSSWLNAVADDEERKMALGVMVGAAHGRPIALHRLYSIACEWAGAGHHPSRAAVAALFWQHIDQAQFIRTEPTERAGSGSPTTEEER